MTDFSFDLKENGIDVVPKNLFTAIFMCGKYVDPNVLKDKTSLKLGNKEYILKKDEIYIRSLDIFYPDHTI